ncbi:MAG: hypothetical protein K0Q90_4423, partial [Paenibacillaceae bacterium]|nr:hypothetical protein [Paenibacillaceae bacterium]
MRSMVKNGTWRKQLFMLSLLPLPDRMLKYFPPGFILRDPVYRRVEKVKRSGGKAALMLFHLEDYHQWLKNATSEYLGRVEKELRKIFLETARMYITEDDFIGVKQHMTNEISLFVRYESQQDFGRCGIVAGKIREEFEKRIERQFSLHMESSLTIRTGCADIEDSAKRTGFAVEAAYHQAMAAAAKNLPAHFAMQHAELKEIIRMENLTVLTQPIMDLRTGEVYGWEILSRGPKNSAFHNPVELFEFADQTALLPELEWLVIQKAVREITERQIKEQVFINITPVSLSEPQLLGRLLEQLKLSGLHSSQIKFEITERHS